MAALPMFFWFGDDFHARGQVFLYLTTWYMLVIADQNCLVVSVNSLLIVTGLGIWLSSVAKDLACCPRPYSPPVIRLCKFGSERRSPCGRPELNSMFD